MCAFMMLLHDIEENNNTILCYLNEYRVRDIKTNSGAVFTQAYLSLSVIQKW